MKKILLFGGAFDPPHMGHMSLLENAVTAVQPDLVLVIPTKTPPHKPASRTPSALRMEMCACFHTIFSPLAISNIEVEREGNSYSWDTVQQIKKEYPKAAMYLCIGSDMLHSFTTWRAYKKILAAVTLVVQDRLQTDEEQSQKAAKELEGLGGHLLFTQGAVRPVSSSEIRQKISKGETVAEYLPSSVFSLIQKNGLYTNEEPPKAGITLQQAQELAKVKLSPKRYKHVENVVDAAVQLAHRFGVDPDKARMAAWLHDIVKEEPAGTLLQLAKQDAIMAELIHGYPKPVWHGPCGAIYAKNVLGVQDEEILSAVENHTTGKVNMSALDKVILVADMISAERHFSGVEEIRRLAEEDLNRAALATLEKSVSFVAQRNLELDSRSLAAIAYLKKYER